MKLQEMIVEKPRKRRGGRSITPKAFAKRLNNHARNHEVKLKRLQREARRKEKSACSFYPSVNESVSFMTFDERQAIYDQKVKMKNTKVKEDLTPSFQPNLVSKRTYKKENPEP